MGNIAEYLRTLRTAVFGKDVRESIAKSIEQTYEDATRSGNANMEVSDARGYYSSLKNRLDTENNNMQSQINGLASGSPLVASSVSEMTDTSRVYVNTSNGHWYTYNGSTWVDGGVYQSTGIADNSINKTNLLKQVKEEYDSINDVIKTYPDNLKKTTTYTPLYKREGIDPTTGESTSSNKRLSTNYIPVGHGIKFTPTSTTYGAWCRAYDKNYGYIGTYVFGTSIVSGVSLTIDEIDIDRIIYVNPNVKFFRLVFANRDLTTDIEAIDYTIIYKVSNSRDLEFSFKTIDFNGNIELEYGAIRIATGIDNPEYVTSAIRSKYYYEVGTKYLETDYTDNIHINVLQYTENFNYIKVSYFNDGKLNLESNCKYIRIQLFDKPITTLLNIKGLQRKIYRNYTINEKMNDCQRLWFDIKGTGYHSSCLFKLPSNYNPNGNSIPMIVFVHGSADYGNISSSSMTQNYNDLYNYLRDNGYAIWDCYGWGNYQNNITNTEGTPFNTNVYCSGIEYFTDLFNIDKNQIYVCGKSYGGIQELALLYQDRIKVRAIGFLAPALSVLHTGFGYTQNERNCIAHFLGMTTPPQTALTYPASQEYVEYFNQNINQLLIYDPYWKGLMVDKDTKLDNSINHRDNQLNQYTNKFKISKFIPLKFWYANDDENVPVRAIDNLIQVLQNSGINVTKSIMPNGTGGHHSVDTDENAPKIMNVTTNLGITYSSVPTAYYEYIQFISQI